VGTYVFERARQPSACQADAPPQLLGYNDRFEAGRTSRGTQKGWRSSRERHESAY
jgi:hypothetical protein